MDKAKALKQAFKDMGLTKSKYLTLKAEVADLVELDGLFVTANISDTKED